MSKRRSRQTAFSRVYLAGKIEKNDWRHDLFPDLRVSQLSTGVRAEVTSEGLIYMGPFFSSCGHGCAHGPSQHGSGVDGVGCFEGQADTELVRGKVARTCLRSIESSTFIYCWIEDLTAYGSLFELGYARAKAKQIFVAVKKSEKGQELSSELWFALTQAHKWVEAESPEDGWTRFREWMKRRRKVADQRKQFKPMTKPQERYLLDLLERCEGLELIDRDRLSTIDVAGAGAMIDCFVAGGDPANDFPDFFQWNTHEV